MSQAPPPVLGFNNNVRHRGRVFHIQTEDSGTKTPRIVTHLFADGGHIIKTTRTEYTEILHRADLPQVVREMMKSQHKAMFVSLRAGEFDALLESACGPLPLPVSAPAERAGAAEAPLLPRTPYQADAKSERAELAPQRDRAPARAQPDSASKGAASPAKPVGSPPPGLPDSAPEQASKAGRSLFGDSLISEKSLDEVILSYLAEDLDGSD